MYVVSVYCDITKQSIPPELIKLMEEMSNAVIIIIGIETNSHSPMWGCDEKNKRGEMMEEFIMAHKLEDCNRGNKATFVARIAEVIIAVTLCTNNMVKKVRNRGGQP